MTDDYLSVHYDNIDQLDDAEGGIRYMQLNKKSVGRPDYQLLQQHNNSGKTWQHNIQQKLKGIIATLVVLGILLILVIVVGCILISVNWIKFNKANSFQNYKQETTSCTLSNSLEISTQLYNKQYSCTHKGKYLGHISVVRI